MQRKSAPRIVTDSPLYDLLRRVAKESGLTAKDIAEKAKVSYQPLNRFLNQNGRHYNGASLALVYHALTGEPLNPAMKPVRKAPRKRRAA